MVRKTVTGIVLATLISSGIAGCSSIGVRTGNNSQLGKPYAGVPYALEGNGVCIGMWMIYGTPLSLPFTLTYAVIDISSSVVADTLLLPFDMFIDEPARSRSNDRCNPYTR